MIIRDNKQRQSIAVNYRSMAPRNANPALYSQPEDSDFVSIALYLLSLFSQFLSSELMLCYGVSVTLHSYCKSSMDELYTAIIADLSTVHCPLSTVHCPLSTVHCLPSTTQGRLAVAVPGEVAGLAAAHKLYGR